MKVSMEVEIKKAYIEPQEKLLVIEGVDCSSWNLMNMERNRVDDGQEKEVRFQFNTRNIYGLRDARRFLMDQKITRGAKTYGEALDRIVGTICDIPIRYRVRIWE